MAYRGRTVEKITHPQTGEVIPIKLDTSSGKFWCEIDGRYEDNLAYEPLAELAREHLEANAQVTWQPVIEVRVEKVSSAFGSRNEYGFDDDEDEKLIESWHGTADCGFSYRRLYIGHAAKGWLQAPWQAKEQSRLVESEKIWYGVSNFTGVLPYRQTVSNNWRDEAEPDHDAFNVLLPYSEETWKGLHTVAKVLVAARRQLSKIMESPEAIARAVGSENVLAIRGSA